VRAGGGYTKNNVARCWAYETAVVVGADANVTEEIPLNPLTQPYYEYFGPEHRLNLHTTREVRRLTSCSTLNPPASGMATTAHYVLVWAALVGGMALSNAHSGRIRRLCGMNDSPLAVNTGHISCRRAPQAMVDENVRADLEHIRMTVIEQLRQLEAAPGTQST